MLCVFRSASHGSGAHFLKGFGCYLGVIALLVGLAFSGADLWLESGEWLQFAIAVWTGEKTDWIDRTFLETFAIWYRCIQYIVRLVD